MQNHPGQEGHGPRHVPHLLPAPGEGGWEEGEFRLDLTQSVSSTCVQMLLYILTVNRRASLVGFLVVADVPVSRQEAEKEQDVKLPHLYRSH